MKPNETRSALDDNSRWVILCCDHACRLLQLCCYGILTVDEAARMHQIEVNALRRKLGLPKLNLSMIKKAFKFGY